jgi:hypothetical protein
MAYIHELNNNQNQSSTSNLDPQPTLFPRVESEQEVIYEESKPNFEVPPVVLKYILKLVSHTMGRTP